MGKLVYNENSRPSTASGGMGFTGALTIVFIVLKLLGKIDWSWVWVLSPLWITLALAILIIAVAIVVSIIRTNC